MDWSLEGQLAHWEAHGCLQLYDPDALHLDSLNQHDHHATLNGESLPRAGGLYG